VSLQKLLVEAKDGRDKADGVMTHGGTHVSGGEGRHPFFLFSFGRTVHSITDNNTELSPFFPCAK
jgi:hypothetical protein